MPKLYRDVAYFAVDFSSRENNWLYQGLFQYENGTIERIFHLTGIDAMKEGLRKLENGTIKVVRRKRYSSFEYEPCETREREVKEMLREKIEKLENNYSYCEESDGTKETAFFVCHGKTLQR